VVGKGRGESGPGAGPGGGAGPGEKACCYESHDSSILLSAGNPRCRWPTMAQVGTPSEFRRATLASCSCGEYHRGMGSEDSDKCEHSFIGGDCELCGVDVRTLASRVKFLEAEVERLKKEL